MRSSLKIFTNNNSTWAKGPDGKWGAVRGPSPASKTKRLTEEEELEKMMKRYLRKKKKSLPDILQEIEDKSYIKKYHSHEEVKELINSLQKENPTLVNSYSIGKSVDGRDLTVLNITTGVDSPRVLLKPMVKYVANIHGDEWVGRELLMGLARYLTEEYNKNERIKNILDTTDIHLVPSLNPDGYVKCERHNLHDEDLNRGFPGWMDLGKPRNELTADREPEVLATMAWILDNPFVLSLSFHDGRVLVNYPWDDSPVAVEGEKAICPDDAVFYRLSQLYAENHEFMWTGKCLCHSETFAQGISNGAEWYLVDNGMQDFNYLFTNCLELTVELSCNKQPPAHLLHTEWENNLDSLLVLLEAVHSGVKGLVRDQDGAVVKDAVVVFTGEKEVRTTSQGEYWKILTPGKYSIFAFHETQFGRLQSQVKEVDVINVIGTGAILVDFSLCLLVTEVFLLSTVQLGVWFIDNSFNTEISNTLHGSKITSIKIVREDCRLVENGVHHLVYRVECVLLIEPMLEFFRERWGETMIRRPCSDFDHQKMKRRLKMYATERWCGRKGEWCVKLSPV